jgi:hypothetical protein
MLPALAACTMLAVTAPVAPAKTAHVASVKSSLAKVSGTLKALQKGVSLIQDVDKGQTGAINGVDARVTTVVANLKSLSDTVAAVVATATTALTQLKDGLTAAGAGLTALSAAVQGPGIAGQLGAAGTAAPGTANTATPATLPTGTMYRQIVLSTAGAFPAGTPIGARTWIRMPDVVSLGYSNTYVCTSAGATAAALGSGYTSLTCAGGT